MRPLAIDLWRQLADGTLRSGDELAAVLNVSRGSVMNAANELLDAGVNVYKIRGQGYRLPQAVELLDAVQLETLLADLALPLAVLPVVDSTNSWLLQAQREHPRQLAAAEVQLAGRGRRGRRWLASPGGSLTFSLAWRFSAGMAGLGGLSLAVGLAVVRVLRRYGADDVMLKWPNDVVHQFRKLAGVLIELQGDMLGPATAVIGIGLNLSLDTLQRQQIDQHVGDLSMLGLKPGRNALLADLVRELHAVLQQFESQGFTSLAAEWARYHAYQDKPVRLLLGGGQETQGWVRGVDEQGALLLETGEGIKPYHGGEVSLRRLEPTQ